MNEALHNYLRLSVGQSEAKMWKDLERLRKLGCKYDDLPADRETFKAGLQALADAGLAHKDGELWMWIPVLIPKPERAQPPPGFQKRSLFA